MANRFFDMYNFEDNKDRTEKILSKFNITKYHYVMDNGTLALLVEIGLNNYRIELHDHKNEMIVRKKRYRRRDSKHPKEYMPIIKSFNNDVIYSSIKFIWEDSQL